jgi:hypothetical protein
MIVLLFALILSTPASAAPPPALESVKVSSTLSVTARRRVLAAGWKTTSGPKLIIVPRKCRSIKAHRRMRTIELRDGPTIEGIPRGASLTLLAFRAECAVVTLRLDDVASDRQWARRYVAGQTAATVGAVVLLTPVITGLVLYAVISSIIRQ